MNKKMLALLLALCLCFSGCEQKTETVTENAEAIPEEILEETPTKTEESTEEVPEETIEEESEETAVYEELLAAYDISMEETGDDFLRLIPQGTNMVLDNSVQMLKICAVVPADEALPTEPEELTDVMASDAVSLGEWEGSYYSIRKEVNDGGVSGYLWDFHYFLNNGEVRVHAVGNPVVGIGTGTQNELFQQCLSTLKVTKIDQ